MKPAQAPGISASLRHQQGSFSLDVSLKLPGRGVTAIYGASGSGKTTLLRCISGLERAQSGYLAINDEVWQDDDKRIFMPVHRRPLGYVFQEASLFSHLNVQRNLEYGLRRVPAVARRVSLDRAVMLFGLEHLLRRQPDTLSGGERQRVAIARALATSPRLLLMDEPLASLDAQRKAEIMPYLEQLHEALDIPVLLVSHALDEVARLADHLVLLDNGRVMAAGPTQELMTRPDLPLAYGDSASAIIEATVAESELAFHLIHADFTGGRVSLLNPPNKPLLEPGQRVRVRIQARDVSITLERQQGTSVQNIFAVRIASLSPDSPGQVMLGLDANGSALLARITTKSAEALQLAPGSQVFAQVKGVALLG